MKCSQNRTKSFPFPPLPVSQGCSSVQGCAQGVWARQRMPGGGAGEERSGPAGEAARSGGGEQCSAQRTQGLSVWGPGLRPGGEKEWWMKWKSYFFYHFFTLSWVTGIKENLLYYCSHWKTESLNVMESAPGTALYSALHIWHWS